MPILRSARPSQRRGHALRVSMLVRSPRTYIRFIKDLFMRSKYARRTVWDGAVIMGDPMVPRELSLKEFGNPAGQHLGVGRLVRPNTQGFGDLHMRSGIPMRDAPEQ